MINQICESLTNKIRQEMPDIDDEKAEVIQYGLELIIGEVPKIILLFAVAIVLKIGWLVVSVHAYAVWRTRTKGICVFVKRVLYLI